MELRNGKWNSIIVRLWGNIDFHLGSGKLRSCCCCYCSALVKMKMPSSWNRTGTEEWFGGSYRDADDDDGWEFQSQVDDAPFAPQLRRRQLFVCGWEYVIVVEHFCGSLNSFQGGCIFYLMKWNEQFFCLFRKDSRLLFSPFIVLLGGCENNRDTPI